MTTTSDYPKGWQPNDPPDELDEFVAEQVASVEGFREVVEQRIARTHENGS